MTNEQTTDEQVVAQAVAEEQDGQADVIPFPETEQAAADPRPPVQMIRPPLRNLVIETDGDRLFLRSNTMGLIELKMCLQILSQQADREYNQKAAPQPPAPAPIPEPAEVPPEPEVAEEPKDD